MALRVVGSVVVVMVTVAMMVEAATEGEAAKAAVERGTVAAAVAGEGAEERVRRLEARRARKTAL